MTGKPIEYMSTRDVAKLIQVTPSALSRAAWERRFTPPAKSPSGGFLWTLEDAQNACLVMRHRTIKDLPHWNRREIEDRAEGSKRCRCSE